MSCRLRLVIALATAFPILASAAPARAADPLAVCQKMVVRQLEKLKKIHLKQMSKCLDNDNKLRIPGPCPDAKTALKIDGVRLKVAEKIAKKCTFPQLLAIGYQSDCAYGPATPGVDGQCAALPVTTVDEFAACMSCWKQADFDRFAALLYASHALEVCDGALDDTSTTCSDLGCTTPLPEQHDLGDTGENDCQRMIGKAGVRYLLKRERFLENCLLKGCDRGTCLAGLCPKDAKVPLKLDKASIQLDTLVKKKCGGNRVPSTTSTFCCRCGPMGGVCQLAPDRATCLADPSCEVMEGKECNTITGKCDNAPKVITWWGSCPNEPGSCPGTTLATIDDLIGCVESSADELVDELLCMQFPNGNACPTPAPTATPSDTPTPSPTPTP